ncbi:Adenylyl cyclase class-3/4/guanylyl cyclase [Moorella glycerini]|uniref:Diguanylate cyclase YdaM n=1 Tax=Neomoorella stamsii TaxID=1266720 RepID=A0A9X7P4X2_9FIRM|nr:MULTISPECIES: GGDEF domain-containing protein [Moorella]PRR69556.1 putative diguanylate cyclase YdaM [Moorella stamsii]CEP68790.1 Adenylyl cyclase class-3/4/guanylyl cyclase [Moorella glycerini]
MREVKPLAGAMRSIKGHQAGNEALRFVAGFIKISLRNDDLAVRFGGEEFVIVLPATDFTKARIPLERIRTQIAVERMLPGGEGLTVSAGVAGYAARDSVDLELIRQADEAMYRAKELGKNRVVFTQSDLGE